MNHRVAAPPSPQPSPTSWKREAQTHLVEPSPTQWGRIGWGSSCSLDRRNFLLGAGAVALAAALPRAVVAKATTESRLVVVILRGAMDGLAAVPPHGDRDYRGLRGDLAIGAPGKSDGAIDLDGFFGLHPALAPLHDVYAQRQLAVVHAVATPYRDRSHFDGQDLLENGTPTPHAVHDGWLNRALGLIGGSQTLGLSVGQSVPLMLRGQAAVTSWSPVKLPEVSPEFLDKVADLYRNDPVFAPALALGLGDQALVDKVSDAPGMESGGLKMNMLKRGSGLVKTVTTTVGKLLADPAGPRVAVIDVPGWDTHANQGTTNGRLAPVLAGLAEGLVSLQQAMAPVWSKTVVLTLTEFGRTAHPNGTGGTDHGTATAAFVMGGAVNGGRVIADWPGLSNARLYQSRDLAPTTDTRALCKAILRNHLGLPQDAIDRVVFPESTAVRPLEDLVVA
jgi:uncharacterized protein (DUF1501 family)